MKKSYLLLYPICFLFSIAASSVPPEVIVYAKQKETGSIFSPHKFTYTKDFDVTVVNFSQGEIDLSKYCFKAMLGMKEFNVDTIDEKLASKKLKNGERLRGVVVFSSNNSDVTQANIVQLTDKCKKN
ncbi:hypothetical protein B488_01880 [Liberibacter crescens BT-1]|uniref:DUF4354 domain-containing protein n=1 Tax=Liberibacter crescens (strain BT-1) TaxID=1215343 RepID=L0EUW8_LIBCB|nr:DUF4354 family protein [Liberibacter crescens]AGA64181.1 hypothetical protein B488_01880 [Liberibacter crescens BT-1]